MTIKFNALAITSHARTFSFNGFVDSFCRWFSFRPADRGMRLPHKGEKWFILYLRIIAT